MSSDIHEQIHDLKESEREDHGQGQPIEWHKVVSCALADPSDAIENFEY